MPKAKVTHRNPWAWVSSLYLAEGLPYVVVMTVAVIMYKGLGISNTDIALYTSWLYLPWVIKPLWSPIVDILKTRRLWIWVMQLIIGGGLAGVALTIPTTHAFQYSLAFLWLLAFSSATQDIAIDGFYLLATTEEEQSFFVGIRSTFYRISTIFGQGLLVIVAGYIQDHTGLAKIDLHVAAKPGIAIVQSVAPEAPATSPLEGELRLVISPDRVEINPEARPRAEVQSLLALVKSNNIAHAFYPTEQRAAPSDAGFWQSLVRAVEPFFRWLGTPFRIISTHLESFLRAHFSPESKGKNDAAGNIGLLTLHLSKPPGKEVVVSLGSRVSLGLKGGDEKSFSVAEGTRIIFNDQNWNQPALAVIQLDPKLKTTAAALMEIRSGNIPFAWSITFLLLAGMFVCFGIYHRFLLPYPVIDQPGTTDSLKKFLVEFLHTFATFFRKKQIGVLLLFLLLYRFGEAQLVKMVAPFLLDAREVGGLGLTTGQFGIVYGTVGIAALTCGGLLGGMLASRRGLRFWLWWMVLAIHLPDAVFVYLATAQPDNFWVICHCIAVEQFGYGFGFTAYMLYMIHIARGEHQTAHYAICTGFMALGMMIPGMFSGWLQDIIGYQHFFVWVLLATVPGFLIVAFIPLEAEFGRKTTVETKPQPKPPATVES
ncbi:MAG: transporter, family, beta-lactamase induction signal transducer AmpG [Pedosphaera sp.]|nr:transporter, family, beta-lactamase induction signal transducer AmpG [Pedosphaera sp.]